MFCLLIFCSIILTNDSLCHWDINSLDYWKSVYLDGKYVASSPFRWNKGDWIKSGFIFGATGGLISQDERVQEWFQLQRTSLSNRFFSKIEPLGSEGAVIALSSVYLSGCLLGDTTLKKTALLCGESALISGVITKALKILIGRTRPYTGKGAYCYSPFSISHQSFPSGHTSTTFAIASCLADECQSTLVGVTAYGIAIMVGLSMIYDNKHWASDVFLGSVIGIGVGRTISKLHKD